MKRFALKLRKPQKIYAETNELRGSELGQDIVHILMKHLSLTYVQRHLPDLSCSVLMNHFILQYCKSSYIPGFPHPEAQVGSLNSISPQLRVTKL